MKDTSKMSDDELDCPFSDIRTCCNCKYLDEPYYYPCTECLYYDMWESRECNI